MCACARLARSCSAFLCATSMCMCIHIDVRVRVHCTNSLRGRRLAPVANLGGGGRRQAPLAQDVGESTRTPRPPKTCRRACVGPERLKCEPLILLKTLLCICSFVSVCLHLSVCECVRILRAVVLCSARLGFSIAAVHKFDSAASNSATHLTCPPSRA